MKTATSYTFDRSLVLRRLRRIEGQARGIGRMVEEDRYCVEIIQQIASMQAAADAVAMMLLQDHLKSCVAEGIRWGKSQRVDEAVDVIRTYMKR